MTAAKHTPGPWLWARQGDRVSIRTPDRGQLVVMDCARLGMQGAAPRFAVWDGMSSGAERGRLGGILEDFDPDHPDARAIIAAPDLLDALGALGAIGGGYCFCYRDRDPEKAQHEPECRDARAALAKAGAA